MSSLRAAMLRVANIVRGIPSKASIDAWPTTVTVRTRVWTGGRPGRDGGFVDTDLLLTPTPHVRELSQEEIRGSGGRFIAGDVLVEEITPAHSSNPGIGYTQVQLNPVVSDTATQTIYVLAGEITGSYSLVDLKTVGAVTYELQLRRTRATP